jgi:excisionase family DNA binding protein
MKLLNKTEVAEILGVSPFSMNRLKGEIGFVKVGPRRVLFDPEAVKNYIEKQSIPPQPRRGSGHE